MEETIQINSKIYLREQLSEEVRFYFHTIDHKTQKIVDDLAERWSNDHVFSEKKRFDSIHQFIRSNKSMRILDMAAGCGSFVLQGLLNGYDVTGIEPEEWKHDLIDIKFQENQYEPNWRSRIKKAVGEDLPFEDESFDHVDSWQTFEHVSSVEKCLIEIRRVLVPGGSAIIRCPNYFSFYEGHYRAFWLPLLGHSAFGKFYVKKILKRPEAGLNTFHPITTRSLTRAAKKSGLHVINIEKETIKNLLQTKFPILKKKGMCLFTEIGFGLWKFKKRLTDFGKREQAIHLLLKK